MARERDGGAQKRDPIAAVIGDPGVTFEVADAAWIEGAVSRRTRPPVPAQ
jgi:hypothetical protein